MSCIAVKAGIDWCWCSFGVVLWEIITKQAPVRGHLREVRDDEAPPGVQQLLEDCINVDVSSALSRLILLCLWRSKLEYIRSVQPGVRTCSLHPQVAQRPDAAEILQRLQVSTPGLAATSSRSLGSVACAPQPLVAADSVPSDLLQQPLHTNGSSGMAGSDFNTPAASTGHNPVCTSQRLTRGTAAVASPAASSWGQGRAEQ